MHPKLSAFLSRRLIDRRGGHRGRVLAAFEANRRYDFYQRPLLDMKRDEKLAALLNHAREHVPVFRDLLSRRGPVKPAEAVAILQSLPVMTRSNLQSDPRAHTSDVAGAVVDDFTGGSTGTPMSFKVDTATQVAREASLLWANDLTGWLYGERVAMLWGSDRDVKRSMENARLDLRWRIENIRWHNAFDMGEDRMAAFHAEMTQFAPHLVVAYAGSIFTFARYLRSQGIRPTYPILGLVSSAEMLAPEMRKGVEEVFGRPVFDRYGNREAGAIAGECMGHAGLHVNESDFHVEVASSDPFKKPGPILITYFRNLAMPLIRYDTGDLGRLEAGRPCSCSRHTVRLAQIAGRQSDNIRTASGKIIHGEFFTHILYGNAGVRQFQFIQETLQQYRLLVAASDDARTMASEWKRKILAALGTGCELEVEFVSEIPALPSGKRKFTLSRVASNS